MLWSTKTSLLLVIPLLYLLSQPVLSYRVAVFGGSGFIGRRVCESLVASGCEVISVSRSGRPPDYYYSDKYTDQVQWVTHDALPMVDDDSSSSLSFPSGLDACVSCVGDVQPIPEWVQLFGLAFDNERLRRDNGLVNERIVEMARRAGARRFVLMSVSYEVAKALEGPIEGYLDGKREAEQAAARAFGEENTVAVGPSLVYGGRRGPRLGPLWRSFVESPPARSYTGTNEFLRNLSAAPLEDWVERMLFSSPIDVRPVAHVAALGALGLITRDTVGHRKQGFFGTDGKPVTYDDILYVDGTKNIEQLADTVPLPLVPNDEKLTAGPDLVQSSSSNSTAVALPGKEPPFEGALIGKKPYLYPLPGLAIFAFIFWALATGKVDELNRANMLQRQQNII